ncbi:MAG TPA: CHAT domain-containing protein [Chthoniobacterales bacterium]|nr:CHAT domain-containing protein [Chthoniobacterales bacterium]
MKKKRSKSSGKRNGQGRLARSRREHAGAGAEPSPPEALRERGAAPAKADARRQEPMNLGASGWDDEDTLLLTIIAHENAAKIHEGPPPLLLATYGSARVTTPIYQRNQTDAGPSDDPEELARRSAGTRWRRIIEMQRLMVSYTNGREVTPLRVTLADGTEKTFEEPDEEFLKVLGRMLFETLFAGPVKRLYDAARFSHAKRRLHIIFSSMIPWIADFPWELAFDPGSETFLATSDVRFTRNVLSPIPANRISGERRRLRILVVSAQPTGSIPLSIEEERGRIVDSFKPLSESGLVEVEVIARATPESLHGCLREQADGEEFDVVHFIGHGVFDEEKSIGYVLFEDENASERPVSASQLLDILRGRGVRIVFLNACETGRGESAKYNQGVAMVLARDGLPAVVANQYSVVDSAASLFSLHFYACLASGIGIADAVREARIAVRYSQTEPMDWGVPVLFARNPHAALCARRKTARGEPLDRAAFPALFGRRHGRRLRHPLRIAVWSMSYALTFREKLPALLEGMNGAQDQFGFLLKERPIPGWLWTLENRTAEDVGWRLDRIRRDLKVDYLLCVTDLTLSDHLIHGLYLWSGDKATAPGEPDLNRVLIFSISNLDPPLHGATFAAALANCIAITLVEDLSGVVGKKDEPKFTLGYFNAEKDVAHIAGKLEITKKMRAAIAAKDKISADQLGAVETLLTLFHPEEGVR